MSSIYCDEAGNSGENLVDIEQPFFVLASNDYSESEANSLLRHPHQEEGQSISRELFCSWTRHGVQND